MTDPQVTIRPMTVADVRELFPHEVEMFGSEAWSYGAYLDELANTDTRYYVVAVDTDGCVLGSGGLMTIGETAQIMTVGVLPASRRGGVGRQIVRHLLARARQQGSDEVLLEVRVDNDAAQKLYESEGFSLMGRRRGYYDNGRVDAITMRLDLRSDAGAEGVAR